MIRAVDNKKLDMTDGEYQLYVKITKSYTTPSNNGAQMFEGLFHTNEQGLIVSLIPPTKKQTSMEVIVFLQNLQLNQHIREMYKIVDGVCAEIKDKLKELKK